MRPVREIPWLDTRNGVYNVFWYVQPSDEALQADPKAKGRTERFGLRTRDPVEAQARYAAFLLEGRSLVHGTSGSAGLTVNDALDDYWREHVTALDDKKRTRVVDTRRQENCILNLKGYFGSSKLLSAVDIPACNAYAAARRSGAVHGRRRRKGRQEGGDSTICRELGVLQAAAKHALRWKRIKQGEMPTFEFPRTATNEDEAAWFTKAELATLFAKVDDAITTARVVEGDDRKADTEQRFRDWMELTYAWGARRASIERLRVEQVTLETDRVNLKKRGERATKKRRPIVPIYPHLRPTLERRVAEAQDGWLFGKSVDYYDRFRGLCEACGLADKAWPHVLRHSRITHMLMDRENPYKVAKLVGDTLATLLRVYGHHSVEFLEEGGNAPV